MPFLTSLTASRAVHGFLPPLLVLAGLSTAPMPSPVAALPESVSFSPLNEGSNAAMLEAQESGQRVEDGSQGDESTRVYANPDGTWTSETAPEPIRVRDDAGEWVDIDTTLVAGPQGLQPRAAAADVVLSDGGDRTFAGVTTDTGLDLLWKWTADLPEPIVAGDTATYKGVVPNGDLVVTVTATGFTHSIVLHQPPKGPVEWTLPVLTQGANLKETATGGLTVTAPKGESLVEAPAPLMWDSSTDAEGDPAVERVATEVEALANGTQAITLAPDEDFLTDPDTVYPVTVDPAFTVNPTGDTWVQNVNFTSGQTSSPELRAGTWNGGGTKARSFLHFDAGAWC